MNNKKRELLRGAINHLDAALRIVESVLDKESDSLENLPYNLQNSELCDRIERAVDSMNEAIEQIESAQESIENAIS